MASLEPKLEPIDVFELDGIVVDFNFFNFEGVAANSHALQYNF